jgi:hypothetical protein
VVICSGDYNAAALLEQILYWSDRTSNKDGWIAKTYEDWGRELWKSANTVRDTVKRLEAKSLIETRVFRSPFYEHRAVQHVRIHADGYAQALDIALSEIEAQSCEGANPNRTTKSVVLKGRRNPSSYESKPTTETIGRASPLPGSHFEPPAIRVMANDTALQMNGYQLVQTYATETGLPAETIWQTGKKVAAALAKAGITPDDVTGFMTEMRTTQRDRYQGYRFAYLAEDLPRWKQNRADKPVAVELTPAQKAAADKALEAERRAWREAQGLA